MAFVPVARRTVHQRPLVVEPDIGTVHTQVEQIVQVFAAKNPRVKAQTAIRFAMQRQAATAYMVGARKARAGHGLADPIIERATLLPKMVVPTVLALRIVSAFIVEVEARFSKDRNALLGELAQAVHGLFQKCLVFDSFIVVDKHHRIESQHLGNNQTEVANGGIACKANSLLLTTEAQLIQALLNNLSFSAPNHQRVHLGELVGNVLNLLGGFVFHATLGGNQNNYLAQTAHLLQRIQAPAQRALFVQGRRMVVQVGRL